MSTETQKPPSSKRPSARARAEAAAWIARLHGPNRTAESEAGFRRWLSEDPERAVAFELLTDTWEKSARLRRRPFERRAGSERHHFRISIPRAAFAAAAAALIAVIGTLWFLRNDAIATGVGEQRTVVLEDGSRVFMNTDTRVIARFDKDARHIELAKGEALFEVAKNANWPFIVTAGDRQVRALGTSFIVRRDLHGIAVTLVEGKVSVSKQDAGSGDHGTASAPDHSSPASDASTVVLTPGQRLTIAQVSAPKIDIPPIKLDSPSIEKVTAWQRGQVALDNTTLADAVADMNRYSKTRIVIEDPSTAAIRVSGIFRAGDQENFAQAVATTYQIELRTEGETITLGGRISR